MSTERVCISLANSNVAAGGILILSFVIAALGIVMSGTQMQSTEDWFKKNDVIQSLSPFYASFGDGCHLYSSWSSTNYILRFVTLSLFILFTFGTTYAFFKKDHITTFRILIFCVMLLTFSALVEDFQSLINGKKFCDGNFMMSSGEGSDEWQAILMYCNGQSITKTNSCSLFPYFYIIMIDIGCVIICSALWLYIGYFKKQRVINKTSSNITIQNVLLDDQNAGALENVELPDVDDENNQITD